MGYKKLKMTLFKFGTVAVFCTSLGYKNFAYASENIDVEPKIYQFTKKEDYSFTEDHLVIEENINGRFSLKGEYNIVDKATGVVSYILTGEELIFDYSEPTISQVETEEDWYLIDDNRKSIDDTKLNSKIEKGAILIQRSEDGKSWNKVKEFTNVFEKDSITFKNFYSLDRDKLKKGYFYRVTIAYKIKQGKKGLLGLKKSDNYEEKQIAEVYEFYVESEEVFNDSKGKQQHSLGELYRVDKTNNGYYGENKIKSDKDPHYGWKLGKFWLSDFSAKIVEDGETPVFTKNVGDKIKLWFELQQDLDRLNGKNYYSIANDGKGYYKEFQTPKTDLERGALFIKKKDSQGEEPPTTYKNYLESIATKDANTDVILLEEGDYEVALVYKVKSQKGIGLTKYSDYKVVFNFKVRNGNSVVYPKDIITGSDLTNGSSTSNGFKIDWANSNYLKVNVTYSRLVEGSSDSTETVVYNRLEKENKEYTEPGIYDITVKNDLNEETKYRIHIE